MSLYFLRTKPCLRFCALIGFISVPLVSGCVSDTLQVQNTQPQPAALNYDPVQRQQAINEIRAKAKQEGSGQPTNAYFNGDGPTTTMSPENQAASIRELELNASQNSGATTDSELEAKQRSIRELQSQARSHYNNALKRIEN